MGINANRIMGAIPTHPGKILQREIDEMGISQADLAKIMEIAPSNLNAIIKGKRNLTVAIAVKIERALNIPYDFWMRLQTAYEYNLLMQAYKTPTDEGADLPMQSLRGMSLTASAAG